MMIPAAAIFSHESCRRARAVVSLQRSGDAMTLFDSSSNASNRRFVVLIANAKGGCGKTTIATNLASYYAGRGQPTSLLDLDPQQSSGWWLKQRPADLPPVQPLVLPNYSSLSSTLLQQGIDRAASHLV